MLKTKTAPRLVRRVLAWPRQVLIALAALLVIGVAARIALPYVVRHQLNTRLQRIPGYSGSVDSVGIHLWRGAYSIRGLAIFRREGQVREPFFLAPHIDFSLAWRELVHGKIVSDVAIEGSQLNFVQGPDNASSQTDLDRRWQEVVQHIFPIDITRLTINRGLLRYVNTTKTPNVDVFIRNLHATATGLRNRPGERDAGEFPAKLEAEGDSLGGGRLWLALEAEPLAVDPHFHLSVKLEEVDLTALNDSLKAYANVDVSRGTFRLAGEMAGRDGGFQGYVKPFFENLDFSDLPGEKQSLGSRIWESIVAATAWVLKNKSRDQLATRIPFQGKFGDPKIGLLATIGNLFRHGFIRAFNPTIEGTLHADNIRADGSDRKADASKPNPDAAPPPATTPSQSKKP
ncbi:MAG: DUF748 domain-containing protein [Opitutaceae bacterium]